jgi:N-methylhydantoinase A
VHFGDAWHETAIYDRLALPVGAEIAGPAILVSSPTPPC